MVVLTVAKGISSSSVFADHSPGEVERRVKDALWAAEVDRRILDLLTQGEYEQARPMLEDRMKARVAGLSPPHPST